MIVPQSSQRTRRNKKISVISVRSVVNLEEPCVEDLL